MALPPPLAGLEPTLPSSWYRSAAVFAIEKERIFCREWITSMLIPRKSPEPGTYQVLDVLGTTMYFSAQPRRQVACLL